MQTVDEFIESLLTEKGITNVDPIIRDEMIKGTKRRLLQQIDEAAINKLSDAQLEQLSELIKDPNFTSTEFRNYFSKCNVDIIQVAAQTMNRFRAQYLGGM